MKANWTQRLFLLGNVFVLTKKILPAMKIVTRNLERLKDKMLAVQRS